MLKLIAESCTGIMKHFPAHKLKKKTTTKRARAPMLLRTLARRPRAGESDLLRRPRTIQKCTFSVQTVPTSWWSRRAPSASDLPATHVLTSKTSTERYELPYLDLTLCYTSNLSDFQIMCMCHGQVSSCKYPRLKEVDDVLGGAAAWENVDTTDGELIYKSRTKTGVPLVIMCCHSNTVLRYLWYNF